MTQFSRSILLWLVIGLMFLLLFNIFSREQTPQREVIFSDFLNQVDKNQVAAVTIQGDSIYVRTVSGERYKTYAPQDAQLLGILRGKGVKIAARPRVETNPWPMILVLVTGDSIVLVAILTSVIFVWRRQIHLEAQMRTINHELNLLSDPAVKQAHT
jgi:cell division protease FtsH